MIAKAVKGRGFRGALAYDLGKEHGQVVDTNMAGTGVEQLSAEFGAIRKMRPNLERAVLHVSLSAALGEKLTDEQWTAIGRQYLEGMDFVHNQYVITRHQDTEHEHIHILANRITNTGKVVSDSKDYERQEVLMRVIERDFGLQQLAPSAQAERRAPTRGEVEELVRTGETSTRLQLQKLADAAILGCSSYTEYQDRLEKAGVELVPVVQLGGAKLSGLMYRLDRVVMKGSDLGKGYSPAGLAKRGVSYEQDRDAEAVRRCRDRDEKRGLGQADPGAAGRQDPERGGAERAAGAVGAGVGVVERGGAEDAARGRQQGAADERGVRTPARSGERPVRGGDNAGQPGRDAAEPGGRAAGLEPLRDDRDDGVAHGGARERVLALVPAADRADDSGRQGAGRRPQARPDPGSEARPEQVDAEIQRVRGERETQARRVLAKAEVREARRAAGWKEMRSLQGPAAPEGLLAPFKQKAHRQSVAAWAATKAAAQQLVDQAQRLVERIKEVSSPKRIAAWAHGFVKRTWPGAFEAYNRHRDLEHERRAAEAEVARRSDAAAAQLVASPREPARHAPEPSVPPKGDAPGYWERFKELAAADRQRPLNLGERRELVQGWDETIRALQSGRLNAGDALQARLAEFQALRKVADQKLAAEVFRVMPPEQGSAERSELRNAYLLRVAIQRQAEASGCAGGQVDTIVTHATKDIAAAIERGDKITVNIREEIEVKVESARGMSPKRELER